MTTPTIAPEVVAPEVVAPVVAPVVARVPKTKADAQYGFPTVALPCNTSTFLGIIAASRVIVQPVLDATGAVVKQGIVLLTIRRGSAKIQATIGTAYLGAIESFVNGHLDKSVEVSFEVCVDGKTTYEDVDGLHFHGINGNRITAIDELSASAYISALMEDQRAADMKLLKDAGADISALVAYLKG